MASRIVNIFLDVKISTRDLAAYIDDLKGGVYDGLKERIAPGPINGKILFAFNEEIIKKSLNKNVCVSLKLIAYNLIQLNSGILNYIDLIYLN